MDVIEITRKLGEAIQQNEAYIKYSVAKENNDNDVELQKLIGDFNLLRMNLNNELSKEDKDDEKVKEINTKLRECYAEVMKNENMNAFNQAKHEMDELVNKINGIISLCIEGEDPATCEPESCGGSCSSCSGCH